MKYTNLKSITVKKFRALNDVRIEFGSSVTVICGKNGTSKSSILGIAAQVFSFDKDYVKDSALDFQTISGGDFKSLPAEHFRFSEKFDVPGSLDVGVDVYDGYTGEDATAELQLIKRTVPGKQTRARPVVRKNSTVSRGNTSRNFTHPTIYLSLNRLQPIPSRDYRVSDFSYLNENREKFLALSNRLLNKTSSAATATSGTISSAVAHAKFYDQDSVSAGEDNVGQIVLALMSFRKLKDEYADYKGGLLLIDEADAGLFPAAQLALIDVLEHECRELGIQVIMTSHSPTLIERVFALSANFRRKFKTIYLSDTYGPVRSMEDMSWMDIYADLHIRTVQADSEIALPSINVYFEDKEGVDFFSTIALRQPFKRYINPLEGVSLGCTNYINLIRKGIPEFSTKSVVVLDADVGVDADGLAAIALLPGQLPPDQLIFEFLYNLPPEDDLWKNAMQYTRPVFIRDAQEIIGELGLGDDVISVAERLKTYRKGGGEKKMREVFKRFYKSTEFQQLLSLKNSQNPWRRWVKENSTEVSNFRDRFVSCVKHAMVAGFGVDPIKIGALEK